jgi:hypothetical protein
MEPSISSGASQRAEPAAVSVADADFSVTSSITLLIPKSQIQASPLMLDMNDSIPNGHPVEFTYRQGYEDVRLKGTQIQLCILVTNQTHTFY